MKLNDQILFMKENGLNKIILLSGDITEYDDLLIANDLDGNEYLVDWDLASYDLQGEHGMFEYWYGDIPLREFIFQREILKKYNLTADQEIDIELLKQIEKEINSKEQEIAIWLLT